MYFSFLWGQLTDSGSGRLFWGIYLSLSLTHTKCAGLLCTSDQPVAQAATYTTHNKHIEVNIHVAGGIRTCIPSNRTAADLRLRPQGHRDWREYINLPIYKRCNKDVCSNCCHNDVTLLTTPKMSWFYSSRFSPYVDMTAVRLYRFRRKILITYHIVLLAYWMNNWSILLLKCDGTRAETRFRLSAKRTIPFKSAGTSVQSTTGSRGVRISGSNAAYTMFRGSVKSTGYPLYSPVSPSLPLPCVTVCHHVSTGLYNWTAHKIFIDLTKLIFQNRCIAHNCQWVWYTPVTGQHLKSITVFINQGST